MTLDERHDREQLERRGHAGTTCLDEDERFAVPLGASFERFDLQRPHTPHPDRAPPDLVLVDPPFFGVSLTQLRAAVDRVARFDRRTALAIAWLARRPKPLTSAFKPYDLKATATPLTYATVDPVPRNAIALYANAAAAQSL